MTRLCFNTHSAGSLELALGFGKLKSLVYQYIELTVEDTTTYILAAHDADGAVARSMVTVQVNDRTEAKMTVIYPCINTGALLLALIKAVLLAAGVAWGVAGLYRRRMLALMLCGRGENAAGAVMMTALATAPTYTQGQPRQVFLFSGHLIDAPDRASPRFPAEKENIAAQAIAEALDQMHAGPDDLALTQGACGGDLLFTEACLARGVAVEWLQPFAETEFIERSVRHCDAGWENRYHAARARLASPPRSTPTEQTQLADDPYERCNLWLLDNTFAYGADKARFICLWNGSGGDGPGGTAHMVAEMRQRGGQVVWLDTRVIFGEMAP